MSKVKLSSTVNVIGSCYSGKEIGANAGFPGATGEAFPRQATALVCCILFSRVKDRIMVNRSPNS